MADRIKFPGDPTIPETGTGQEPQIPLNKAIPPTTVEMLDPDKDRKEPLPVASKGKQQRAMVIDDDAEGDEEDETPEYSREQIGARIGLDVQSQQAVAEVEQQLDTEDCVPMLFPTNVKLQDAGIMHSWAPGMHMVPISLAGIPGDKTKPMHWWLRRNSVRRAAKQTVPNPRAPQTAEAED